MKKYQLLHQELSVAPLTLGMAHRGFHRNLQLKYTAPLYFKPSVIVYKGTRCDWYGEHANFRELGEKIVASAVRDSHFKDRLLKDTVKIGQKLFRESEKIDRADISRFSDRQLAQTLARIYSLGEDLCDVGMVAAAPDVAFDNFSKRLKDLINQKIKARALKRTANEYFNVLTNYGRGGLTSRERLALLKLALKTGKKEKVKKIFATKNTDKTLTLLKDSSPETYRSLDNIRQQYGWLGFGHLGPGKDLVAYAEELKNLLREGQIALKIKTIPDELRSLRQKQAQYFQELRFNSAEKRYFQIAQNFSYNKSFRYDMLLYAYFILDKLRREISVRISFPTRDLLFSSPEEIGGALLGKKSLDRADIKERQKLCVVTIKGQGVSQLSGKAARDYIKKNIVRAEVKKNITTIHGTAASLGRVTGRVKIVNSTKDMAKVQEGDILVAVQTTPDLVPAMKKAAAFVTDIGGITSHAAIVAREMKKPCIIGTKFASQVLKDNDLVDVNANEGDVRKIV